MASSSVITVMLFLLLRFTSNALREFPAVVLFAVPLQPYPYACTRTFDKYPKGISVQLC